MNQSTKIQANKPIWGRCDFKNLHKKEGGQIRILVGTKQNTYSSTFGSIYLQHIVEKYGT